MEECEIDGVADGGGDVISLPVSLLRLWSPGMVKVCRLNERIGHAGACTRDG